MNDICIVIIESLNLKIQLTFYQIEDIYFEIHLALSVSNKYTIFHNNKKIMHLFEVVCGNISSFLCLNI